MTEFHHVTVLRDETVGFLEPHDGGLYVDCTLGGGGHAELLLERSAPTGRVVGLDRDDRALAAAQARLSDHGARLVAVKSPFSELREVLDAHGIDRVDGVLADLGVSSPQLDDGARGFSFSKDGPLDMRMDDTSGETARELIDRLSESALADVLYQYGEEHRSRAVARSIVRARDEGALETTDDLARAVRRVLGPKRGRIDPATRTFQALRIAVNGELSELEALLATAPSCLREGGVLAIISFHSLEDRIVKHTFRGEGPWAPCTKKPVEASDAEAAANPRARSAKLRAARYVPEGVA